jgi:flagellar motor switch protein FliM
MFTKTEIDLLLKRARAGQLGGQTPEVAPNVEPFDFQGANHLSSGQVERLLQLHTEFAGKLAASLSTLLGMECKANAVSADQVAYGELVKQFPESVLFETVRSDANEGSVLMQADVASVLPIIDLMLGGGGASIETARPLTGIEQEVFKPVVDMFGADLQTAWASLLQASLKFEQCVAATSSLPPAERVLSIKLDIHVGEELHGTWTLILPALVSNALTRKLEQQSSKADSDGSEQNQHRLRERLLNSHFRLELFLPPSGLSVRKLAHLTAGQVLVLKPRSTDPIHFSIAGINLFHAAPVSCGARRGAQIKRTLSIVKTGEKEAR